MKKYLLTINGYGQETSFVALTPESYSFWFQKNKENTSDVVDYIYDPEGNSEGVPDEFNFLMLDGEFVDIYDSNVSFSGVSFLNLHSPNIDACKFVVGEVDEDGFCSREILECPFEDHEELLHNEDFFVEYEDIPEQILEVNSYEKGTFFGAYFEAEDFNLSLLKFVLKEAPNGEFYLVDVFYDEELLINTESNTRGKGTEVQIWEK